MPSSTSLAGTGGPGLWMAQQTGASLIGLDPSAAGLAAARARATRVGLDSTELGIRRLRTRPYRPRTNGKAERFIQTLQAEWAYAATYQDHWHRRRALWPWLEYYNWQRPHSALGHKRPPAASAEQRCWELHLERSPHQSSPSSGLTWARPCGGRHGWLRTWRPGGRRRPPSSHRCG